MSKTDQEQIQTRYVHPDGLMPVAWLAPLDGKGDFIALKFGANKLGRGQNQSMLWHEDRRISRNLGVFHVIMDSKRPLFVLTVLSKVFITKKNCVENARAKEIKGKAVCEIDLGDTISFLPTSRDYCLVWEPLHETNKNRTQHDADASMNFTTANVPTTAPHGTSAATSPVSPIPTRRKNEYTLFPQDLPPRKKMRTAVSSALAEPPTEAFAMGVITAGKVRNWASVILRLATADHQLACESQQAMLVARLLRIVEHLAKTAPKDDTGGLRALADLGVLDALYSVLVDSRCSWPPGWRVSPEYLPIVVAARPAFQRFQAVYPSPHDADSASTSPRPSGLGTVRYGDRLAEINQDGEGVTDRCGSTFDGVVSWMVTLGPQMTANETAPAASSKSLQYGEFDFFSLACVLHTCLSRLMSGNKPPRQFNMVDLGSGSGKVVVAASLLWPSLFSRLMGIEVLPHLHAQAVAAARSHDKLKEASLAETGSSNSPIHQQMNFFCGDFLDQAGVGPSKWRWWEGGDVDLVVAHSTCFSSELMRRIAQRSLCLRPGSVVVTTSAPLHVFMPKHGANAFELIRGEEFWMPWGTATVFVQQRI